MPVSNEPSVGGCRSTIDVIAVVAMHSPYPYRDHDSTDLRGLGKKLTRICLVSVRQCGICCSQVLPNHVAHMSNYDRRGGDSLTNDLVNDMCQDRFSGDTQEDFRDRERVGAQPAAQPCYGNDCSHEGGIV